jgi:hypothetical protein
MWNSWRHILGMLAIASVVPGSPGSAQQIDIPRVDLMPNHPSPYVMRNWKQVAIGYDSLVFNDTLSGTYLPLVSKTSQGFSLSSYVGQDPSQTKEAINCLPAVIGATLVGVDKTNEFGSNWVSLCQNWFNASSQESVYLNSPGGTSGSDWWYDLMPNIFFYQLYSLYPNVGNFQYQFTSVADRWLAALKAMGASTAPWSIANLHHTAWNLSTMTPTDLDFFEPEAGGSIAWLLYNAFVKTGNPKYRIGAELAMESLLVYPTGQNPSYELQLPYGAYIAARMNAELGTTYDIGKLVNWCFSDGSDNSRNWGVTTGTWGGYDCYGLIGETSEATGNGYPFAMNSFEQVGALVPMVRYDARFARAIGKYVLNAANAARLFYTNYLPDGNQDGAAWSHSFDPNSYIAHESMHEYNPANSAIRPYATGDAIGNGNPTNFALYGSSHVGIFGGIIDTTDVPMILRLDVLKTDYFHDSAFPTFLYFNPDSVQRSVSFDAGTGPRDLYDAVSHSFIVKGVSGVVALPIKANSAVLVVNAPGGGTVTYDLDKMLINGTVVDYHSGYHLGNYPPRIKSLATPGDTILTKHSSYVYCVAQDQDGDALGYGWSTTGGILSGSGQTILWTAPDTVGTYVIRCVVNDGRGDTTSATDTLTVAQFINHPPSILKILALPRKIDLGSTSMITCIATDPDSDSLTYHWFASNGTLSGSGRSISWNAPTGAGNYYVRCLVEDSLGSSVTDSIGLEVRDFSNWPTGNLVAYYPFSGNANDASGNGHNGSANYTTLVNDRFGNSYSAYSFNGTSSSVIVPNDPALNFQNAITVNFWLKAAAFYSSREQYPLSHGSWQNRWKFSISPNSNTLRWTVRNSLGQAKDLDSETHLVLDSLYNVTGTYNGSDFEVYLNGRLDAFTSFSGLIDTTTIALSIGQDLPGDNNYDFNGTLDDIRIYDYMLPVSQIAALYDIRTGIDKAPDVALPTQLVLQQNYPNPFNPSTVIRFAIPPKADRTNVKLEIFDLLGRHVDTLAEGVMSEGYHTVEWNAAGFPSGVYFCRLMTSMGMQVRKLVLMR